MATDLEFLAELTRYVEGGEVSNVMVVCTKRDGTSIIVGPGLDHQLTLLSTFLPLSDQARRLMESGALVPTHLLSDKIN